MGSGFQITPILPPVTAPAATPAPNAPSSTAASAAVTAAANAQTTGGTTAIQNLFPNGQPVTAQVSQILDNGMVRLTTPMGTLDVKPSIPIPVGVAVVVQPPQGNAPLKLSLPPSIAPVGAAVSAAVVSANLNNSQHFNTMANTLNSQSLSFMAEMAAASQTGNRIPAVNTTNGQPLPQIQIPQQISDVIRQVVGQAVTTAVMRQDSMLPLFSNLKQAVAQFGPPLELVAPTGQSAINTPQANNALLESVFPHRSQPAATLANVQGNVTLNNVLSQFPPAVLQAAERVLATQMPLGQNATAGDIRNALLQSGLFTPHTTLGTAQSAGLSPTPTVDAALKLLGFPPLASMPSPRAVEKALTSIIAEATKAAGTPQAGNLVPAGGATPGVPHLPAAIAPGMGMAAPAVETIARLLGINLPVGAPINLDMLRQAVLRASNTAAPAKNTSDALKTILGGATPPQGLGNNPHVTVKSALSDLRQALMQWLGHGGEIQAVSSVARKPSPPRPVGNPSAQINTEQPLTREISPHQMGLKLLAQTEAALARQGLLQWASLPEGAERAMGRLDGGAAPPIVFEVPTLMNNQNAVIQFHIEHEADNTADDNQNSNEKTWQAKFAVAFEPLGSIHAHVTLRGDVTNITLWAEREEAAEVITSNLLDLRDSLAGANFEVHDIVCRAGAPAEAAAQTGPRASQGYFLDQKT